MTAARASRMSAHTGVPTSTTLRCSSGLMLVAHVRARGQHLLDVALQLAGLGDRRSGTLPRCRAVKAFAMATGSGAPALGERAVGSARSTRLDRNAGTWPPPEVTLARDVPERRVRNPSTSPWKTKGSRSTTRSRKPEAAGDELGERLPLQVDLLLHHVGRAQRVGQRGLPLRLRHLPADVHALAAVLVVRLQHQLVAVRRGCARRGRSRGPSRVVRPSRTRRVQGTWAAMACALVGR